MQFEEFDKKIREAADHHHPAYDEQAWAKMEKLLNKHMPVKKDRRRGVIFFLLFLGLLMGGASYYYFNGRGKTGGRGQEAEGRRQEAVGKGQEAVGSKQEAEGKGQEAVGSKQEAVGKGQEAEGSKQDAEGSRQEAVGSKQQSVTSNTQPVTSNPQPVTSNQQPASSNTNDRNTTDRPVPAQQAGTVKINSALLKQTYDHALQDAFNAKLDQQRRLNASRKQSTRTGKDISRNDIPAKAANDQQQTASGQFSGVASQLNDAGNISAPVYRISLDEALKNTVSFADRTIAASGVRQIKIPQLSISEPSVANTKKSAPKVRSTFFISASAGPDVSVVGVSNTGTVKLVGGGGLGYTYKGRFTLRTGFYTARKVYTASPDQYHPPAVFWNYYPNLQKVDADCKVYEIPLLFTYNFAKKGNANWFAGTGISSYLMKKETYNYFYKNSAGINTSRKYTLLDKNHHYFSVLTLSAGYQRSLSKSLFITAEPYFKVPLSGIGYGKINLNGAGVLFSAGWAPFHAKKTRSH